MIQQQLKKINDHKAVVEKYQSLPYDILINNNLKNMLNWLKNNGFEHNEAIEKINEILNFFK